MQIGLSTHRNPSTLVALGCLLILACTKTAEAGITLSGGGYKGIGDPEAFYFGFAYLDPGSSLVDGSSDFGTQDFFTLHKLIGIEGGSDYEFITRDPQQEWGAAFGKRTSQHLIVNGIDKGLFPATDVTFFYEGPAITNTTGHPLYLGEFMTWEDENAELPDLPGGYKLPITYDFRVGGLPVVKGIPFSFTVTPEPSSFVVAALVGCCATGVALLRRRRRVA